jgi:hypothetical protein
MDEMLGYCGNLYDLCPAYEKNLTSNTDKNQISNKWFRYFNFRIPPEEISCIGCKNDGKHADSECPVRPCAIKKGLENCAPCDHFGCENLRSRMDFIENNVKDIDKIPSDDYKFFIEPYLGKKRLLAIREK